MTLFKSVQCDLSMLPSLSAMNWTVEIASELLSVSLYRPSSILLLSATDAVGITKYLHIFLFIFLIYCYAEHAHLLYIRLTVHLIFVIILGCRRPFIRCLQSISWSYGNGITEVVDYRRWYSSNTLLVRLLETYLRFLHADISRTVACSF